jgi:hypothetical protein
MNYSSIKHGSTKTAHNYLLKEIWLNNGCGTDDKKMEEMWTKKSEK